MGNAFTVDTLQSLVAGLGDPLRDKLAGASYGSLVLSAPELSDIYRSNWIGKKIVNIPADDAVRKGRDWQAEAQQIGLIEAEEAQLGFWGKLHQALVKARLWGGSAIFIGTGDANLDEELRVERIGKGGLKYLTLLNRSDLAAGEIDQDVTSEFHGRPAYYEVTGATGMVRIHPSRLVLLTGALIPDQLLAGQDRGWGDSVLQSAYTAMKNADATAANVASLIFEANVDVFRIPDFMANLAAGGDYRDRLLERFRLAAMAKGINRALILDKDEEYDRKQITFSALPDVMQTMLQMAAAASDIPAPRFLSQSPAGLNSTGTHDMKNHHDRIAMMQALEITPALARLDECLIRSALGSRPAEIFYSWAPLEQMSEKELAEIGKMNAETAKTLVDAGLFTPQELRTVVTTQLVESSFYPGLDQAVAETDAGGGFDLGEETAEEAEPEEGSQRQQAADAAPRSLYVRRDVLNAAEIISWAKEQGFKAPLAADDLHVTVMYSRTAVDWMKAGQGYGEDENGQLIIPPGGPRLIERFDGGAIVLQFNSSRLGWRHMDLREIGCEPSYDEYAPHVTITCEPGSVDLEKVEPYRGKIVLGPEIFEEINDDWKPSTSEE